jgi:hypothetical protein
MEIDADIAFQIEALTDLSKGLAEPERLPFLLKSLGWLERGGVERSKVQAIGRQVSEQLGIELKN